ncbi:MAG: GspE/PulE family protein [Chitinispirillaceae bacterium]|jgi:type II secretory ATPase GspE/PulE/Tfp pilus assembly ATPase PilB-like protein|nr:GspE/PulE family protein [Chitinispirillaceae bacterium]
MTDTAEELIFKALAEEFSLPFTRISEWGMSTAVASAIPRAFAEKHCCFPLAKKDSQITLAIADPRNIEIIGELEFATGCTITRMIATEHDIRAAIEQAYGSRSRLAEDAKHIARDLKESDVRRPDSNGSIEVLRRETEAEPVVRMVNLILDDAVAKGASDIHIEPHEDSLRIRNRIDGMLLEMMSLPGWMQNPLTSRIKILANLDIAEKRVPQDGRIKRTVAGSEIDMRVSTLPTHHGEKTVIRLLRHNETLLKLESLGLDGQDLVSVIDIINKPQGMLFITGPTGSGKSSTLFACLNRIREKSINITTIEDPIEYKLQGVNQVQINEKAGLTFADSLRSILRQDPDVILVGEIRDGETAQIALQSSQTGHLVFSTLHTNDSVSAVTRLRDLGIPPFLIASGVLGVIAQRLVRVICPECKETYSPTPEVLHGFKTVFGDLRLPQSWIGTGCQACNKTGYRGRTGIFECLKFDSGMRELITQNEAEHRIRAHAKSSGMKPLVNHGLEKVSAGITSIEELLRVVLVE